MILTKYLVCAILKNQLIVFVVLFLVFFSQKFIRVFSAVVDNNIPKFLVCVFFGLGLPEVVKLILPVSLFFAILITFNYLHIYQEIIAMFSCGLGYTFIIRGVLFVSVVTTVFSIINILFLSPLCLYYQNKLLLKHQFDFTTIELLDCKFHFLRNVNTMLFVDRSYKNGFKNIFLIKVAAVGHDLVMVADYGYIKKDYDATQWIVLEFGNYYSWNRDVSTYSDFYINHFDYYKFLIDNKKMWIHEYNNSVEEMSVYQLWCSSKLDAKVELNWRLTLVIVGFIMAMIIFPLSLINLHHNYLLNIFPALILYFIFFIVQIFLRANVSKGGIDLVWIWVVNLFYICIAVILNFWDSLFFRNIRWKVKLFFYNDN